MKIIICPFFRKSHIYPIRSSIKELVQSGHEVYVFYDEENKEWFEELDVNLIKYPPHYRDYNKNDDLFKLLENDLDDIDMRLLADPQLVMEKYYTNSHSAFALGWCGIRKEEIEFMRNQITIINPDVIIRDSLDVASLEIAAEMNIEVVSYVTNNLYSLELFKTDLPTYLSYYFELLPTSLDDVEKYSSVYLNSLFPAYSWVKEIKGLKSIYPFFAQAPKEKNTIIFSSKYLQPKIIDKENNYHIIVQEEEYYEINKDDDFEDEQNFIERNIKKVVYLSLGSYIQAEHQYIVDILEFITKMDFKVICSLNHDEFDELKKTNSKLNWDNILLKKSVNQKYVLSKVDLFICAGGFNSIQEAIYYKVPMYVLPLLGEQNLNGLIIESLQVGFTDYKRRDPYQTTGELICHMAEYLDSYKAEMEKLALRLKIEREEQDLKQIWKRILSKEDNENEILNAK